MIKYDIVMSISEPLILATSAQGLENKLRPQGIPCGHNQMAKVDLMEFWRI